MLLIAKEKQSFIFKDQKPNKDMIQNFQWKIRLLFSSVCTLGDWVKCYLC